jgi:hypothetical protein
MISDLFVRYDVVVGADRSDERNIKTSARYHRPGGFSDPEIAVVVYANPATGGRPNTPLDPWIPLIHECSIDRSVRSQTIAVPVRSHRPAGLGDPCGYA